MSSDFEQLVDTGDLSPDDRRRLERVHSLLVAAGPPPELPAALERPPAQPAAPAQRRLSRRQRIGAGLALAATLVAASVGGGYLLGSDGGDKLDVERVLALATPQGTTAPGIENASASIKVGAADAAGNRLLELTVKGLPPHANERGYYELFLERDGKPGLPCGGFKVVGDEMTFRFPVPYRIDEEDVWVLTTIVPGEISWPGDVLMRT